MDNATGDEMEKWDLDSWSEASSSEEKRKRIRGKKRRRPMRKNRKPSRPSNYIGQRSNNNLLRMFAKLPLYEQDPQN